MNEALAQYKEYVLEQVDNRSPPHRVHRRRAGRDVQAAKDAFAPSRQAWETIEPIAGLVEDIDGAVDARVDDFDNEDDPALTGWHKLEYLLWENDIAPPRRGRSWPTARRRHRQS